MIKTYTQTDLAPVLRRFLLMIVLMVPVAVLTFGQTAGLEHKTALPGASTTVNLDVTGFDNVNAITLEIRYNPAVLSLISCNNISPQLVGGTLTAMAVDSTIHIVWYSTTASTVNGTLCKLNFQYHGTSSPLTFLPGSVVTQGQGTNLLIGYFNGSVSPAPCPLSDAQVTLVNASGVAGSQITVPVTFSNFPVTGALTQHIQYDASRLTFVSATKAGALAGANVDGGNGVVNIAWTNPAGANINTTATTYLNLNFMVVLPGTSAVTFGPGCLATTPSTANIGVCYNNGTVSQTPTTETAALGSLNTVVQGAQIQIPLDLNISAPVSSFTLYIHFNAPLLAYNGIEQTNPLSSMVMSYVNGSTLSLVYTNPAATVIAPGTFLKLKFKYNGVGTGHVDFTGACQFSDNAFPLPQPINVAYTNGTVAAGTYPPIATATIGSVTGNVGTFVDVPVEIDGSVSNPLGAATMYIGYDMAKLSYISVVGNTYNATVNPAGGQINIAWADPAGASLTGTFLYLRFMYHGGAGLGCSSPVWFKNDQSTLQPCELANQAGSFTAANWVNGGVNLQPAPPAVNGPANPNSFSVVNYFTDAGMINYNWVVTGGSVTSGAGSSSVGITWGPAGPGNIQVSYTTPGGCNMNASKPITIVNGNPLTDIQGFVTYDNVVSQGMNGVNITLINSVGVQVGMPVATFTNGTHGYYQFTGVPQDDYTLAVSLAAPWAGIAGVTALDALLVELQTAGVLNPPLAGLRLGAADVNDNNTVNATDALLIKQRIIGAITSFAAGDWVFDNGVVHAFPGPVSVYDFEGLCTGDVNGSYNPVAGVKSTSRIEAIAEGIQQVGLNTSFTFDLRSAISANLGAMTLFLGYDPAVVEVEKIVTNIDGLEYTIRNGKVAIAWSSTLARTLEANGTVISLQAKVRQAIQEPQQLFTILPGSELASAEAEVLSGHGLKMASIITEAGQFSVTNYPNPFRTSTNIAYNLPSAGMVRVILTDIVGTQIGTLAEGSQKAGAHSVTLDATSLNLRPGIYLCRITAETETDNYSRTIKIIYAK